MGIPINPAISLAPPKGDQANMVAAGSFAVDGVGPWIPVWGAFNIFVYASGGGTFTGSVQIERSFDGGVTPIICGIGGDGTQAIYATGGQLSLVVSEPEQGMLWRVNCTALSGGGPVNWRFSTTSPAATAWGIPPG